MGLQASQNADILFASNAVDSAELAFHDSGQILAVLSIYAPAVNKSPAVPPPLRLIPEREALEWGEKGFNYSRGTLTNTSCVLMTVSIDFARLTE